MTHMTTIRFCSHALIAFRLPRTETSKTSLSWLVLSQAPLLCECWTGRAFFCSIEMCTLVCFDAVWSPFCRRGNSENNQTILEVRHCLILLWPFSLSDSSNWLRRYRCVFFIMCLRVWKEFPRIFIVNCRRGVLLLLFRDLLFGSLQVSLYQVFVLGSGAHLLLRTP